MVKASEGGGGKGIRKVHKEDELEGAFRQVKTQFSENSKKIPGTRRSTRLSYIHHENGT
jgi:biotin carboxylase